MGKTKSGSGDETSSSLSTSIIDTIRSSKNGKSMDLTELRAAVLSSSYGSDDETDQSSKKKLFKSAVKQLEKEERVSLSADGIVKLSKSERAKSKKSANEDDEETKSEKKKKKDKKRKRESKDRENDEADLSGEENDEDVKKQKKRMKDHDKDEEQNETTNDDDDEAHHGTNNDTAAKNDDDPKNKNKPCKNNPQGITRLFLGNLPFAVCEPTLNTFLKDSLTHVKWITDKETGKFYGSAFVEVRNSKDAAHAMTKLNGTFLMGRPIKINYAPMKAGEERDWPPKNRVIVGGKVANQDGVGGGMGQAGGAGIKAMSVMPEGCVKLFMGNLSFEIDDEGITKFFMSVDAELKSVRWLHHRHNNDFKGCGYAEFWNSQACEKAATLNGKHLLGRPIRLDWAE